MIRFNDVTAAYEEQRAGIDAAIAEVVQCGDFIGGRAISEFDKTEFGGRNLTVNEARPQAPRGGGGGGLGGGRGGGGGNRGPRRSEPRW